jgi:hypothetical protein
MGRLLITKCCESEFVILEIDKKQCCHPERPERNLIWSEGGYAFMDNILDLIPWREPDRRIE